MIGRRALPSSVGRTELPVTSRVDWRTLDPFDATVNFAHLPPPVRRVVGARQRRKPVLGLLPLAIVGLDHNGFVRFRGTSPRFVGRAAELGLLDGLLAEALAGEPVTALVCGEAGAGKTRLVSEVAEAARRRGTRTLVGSCTMVGGTSLALAPFAEALRPVVQELAMGAGDAGDRVAPRLARLVAAPMDAAAAIGTCRIRGRWGCPTSFDCSRRCSILWSTPRCPPAFWW